MKFTIFKNQPLTKVIKAIPRKYGEQMLQSEELVSAIYYTKDEFVVTSSQAMRSIEKIGDTDNKKIAIAYNFSEEATIIFKDHGYNLVQYSNFPWTDEQWKNSISI